MPGKMVDIKTASAQAELESGRRERSTIGFPYGDLDDAIEVARAINSNAGISCTVEQLAAYMGQSATSGAFRLNLSTVRMFGLTELEKGQISLTDLGRRIVDPTQERISRSEAFLRVPLYEAIYKAYKAHMLPPPAALEKEMARLGVSSKQTDKARQAFERSAQQAGFFEHGKERLVLPAFQGPAAQIARTEKPPTHGGGGGGGTGDSPLHEAIRGMLRTLPESGKEWPVEQRVIWLQTVGGIFDLIYKGNTSGVLIAVKSLDPSNVQLRPS